MKTMKEITIKEEEFLEMLSMYWLWNHNDECEAKTKEYCKKIGISSHNFVCWTGEDL